MAETGKKSEGSTDGKGGGMRALLMAAAGVIVIAGLKAAGSILVPVLLAAFLAVLSMPPIKSLQRRGLPDWAAVIVVFLGVLGGFVLVSAFLGNSVQDFMDNLPEYERDLEQTTSGVIAWFNSSGLARTLEGWGYDLSTDTVKENLDPGAVMGMAGGMISSLTDVLSNTAFVLLTVVFIMLEAAGLPRKLRAAMGDPTADIGRFTGIVDGIQGYLRIKTWVSLGTGVLVAVVNWAVGVDYPILWGMFAFALNFVPNLGSIIAAVPAVLLAFVQYGWERALILLVAYVIINVVVGSVIEPKLMGRRLGLSTLVVFLSLVFWGWVWGPVGMLLSVPLTMVVKILLENSQDLRWLGILLGSGADAEHHIEASQSQMAMKTKAVMRAAARGKRTSDSASGHFRVSETGAQKLEAGEDEGRVSAASSSETTPKAPASSDDAADVEPDEERSKA
jgi:predicted PurR-regulated permease PerM